MHIRFRFPPCSRLLPVLSLLLGTVSPLYAQRHCATDSLYRLQRQVFPLRDLSRLQQAIERQAALRTQSGSGLRVIPTVVHIVHQGEALGAGSNLSAAQVWSQLHVLNEDYNRLNADASQTPEGFRSVAGSTGVLFKLTAVDPQGNVLPEPGIHRMQRAGTFSINALEGGFLRDNQWDPARFLNIWVISFSNSSLLGFAYFPVAPLSGLDKEGELGFRGPDYDGVVIGAPYFGSNRKGASFNLEAPYDMGRTTTHEVGHWLGLLHPWGINEDCDPQDDDFCSDTPLTNRTHVNVGSPCNQTVYSCERDQQGLPKPDMFQNYMSYADDGCMNLFTLQQALRMRQVLQVADFRKSMNALAPANAAQVVMQQRSARELRLLWSDAATDERVYVVERSRGDHDFEIVSVLPAGSQSYTDLLPEGQDPADFFYRVYAANEQGYSPASNIVNAADRILGIPEAPLAAPLRLFPNPSADGRFQVAGGLPAGSRVAIFNALGRQIGQQVTALTNADMIDLSGLPPGVYLLRLPDGRYAKAVRQ